MRSGNDTFKTTWKDWFVFVKSANTVHYFLFRRSLWMHRCYAWYLSSFKKLNPFWTRSCGFKVELSPHTGKSSYPQKGNKPLFHFHLLSIIRLVKWHCNTSNKYKPMSTLLVIRGVSFFILLKCQYSDLLTSYSNTQQQHALLKVKVTRLHVGGVSSIQESDCRKWFGYKRSNVQQTSNM